MNRPFNRQEIELHMEHWDCDDYTISDDLTVDIQSTEPFYIRGNFGKLPLRFGKVEGNFICKELGLTTLEGCPEIVEGDFNCDRNLLTDLKGCPKEVGGNFNCERNNITSLVDCPKKVGFSFFASSNRIRNFDGFDCDFDHEFYIHSNPVGSIVEYGDKDFIKWSKTYKVIKDDVVNLKRLRYVMGEFDRRIDISKIKKYYEINE